MASILKKQSFAWGWFYVSKNMNNYIPMTITRRVHKLTYKHFQERQCQVELLWDSSTYLWWLYIIININDQINEQVMNNTSIEWGKTLSRRPLTLAAKTYTQLCFTPPTVTMAGGQLLSHHQPSRNLPYYLTVYNNLFIWDTIYFNSLKLLIKFYTWGKLMMSFMNPSKSSFSNKKPEISRT